MNRRDLLKLFGAGSIIAPVIGGVTHEARATVITPPEIELVSQPRVRVNERLELQALFERGVGGVYDITVEARNRSTGRVLRWEGPDAVLIEVRYPPVEMLPCLFEAAYVGNYRRVLPGPAEVVFRVSGPITTIS